MNSFDVKKGNTTITIPSEITIDGINVELEKHDILSIHVDHEDNLTAVELTFDAENYGTTALYIKKDIYDNLHADFGLINDEEQEHTDDIPYDRLPEEPLDANFQDNLSITIDDGFK